MNLQSEDNYVGGISGYGSNTNVSKNLSLGNIYTTSSSISTVRRIIGDASGSNNYSYAESLINGIKDLNKNNEIMLTYSDLTNFEEDEDSKISNVYNNKEKLNWGSEYTYINVEKGVLPKLNYKGTNELLPNQEDIYIKSPENIQLDVLKVYDIEADKLSDNPSGKFKLDIVCSKDLEIIGIETEKETKKNIETLELIKNDEKLKDDGFENGIKILSKDNKNEKTNQKVVLAVKPNMYYSNYKITKIKYKLPTGEIGEKETNIRVDIEFFIKINNTEQWVKYVEKENIGTYQNYIIMNSLDFSKSNSAKGRSNNRKINWLSRCCFKWIFKYRHER